ncbi:MAG: hypothetical protein HYV28_04890 [Ignavibacteriales bacterium]|nr:hypothetical protein [Ignavibacteriales bacterium]
MDFFEDSPPAPIERSDLFLQAAKNLIRKDEIQTILKTWEYSPKKEILEEYDKLESSEKEFVILLLQKIIKSMTRTNFVGSELSPSELHFVNSFPNKSIYSKQFVSSVKKLLVDQFVSKNWLDEDFIRKSIELAAPELVTSMSKQQLIEFRKPWSPEILAEFMSIAKKIKIPKRKVSDLFDSAMNDFIQASEIKDSRQEGVKLYKLFDENIQRIVERMLNKNHDKILFLNSDDLAFAKLIAMNAIDGTVYEINAKKFILPESPLPYSLILTEIDNIIPKLQEKLFGELQKTKQQIKTVFVVGRKELMSPQILNDINLITCEIPLLSKIISNRDIFRYRIILQFFPFWTSEDKDLLIETFSEKNLDSFFNGIDTLSILESILKEVFINYHHNNYEPIIFWYCFLLAKEGIQNRAEDNKVVHVPVSVKRSIEYKNGMWFVNWGYNTPMKIKDLSGMKALIYLMQRKGKLIHASTVFSVYTKASNPISGSDDYKAAKRIRRVKAIIISEVKKKEKELVDENENDFSVFLKDCCIVEERGADCYVFCKGTINLPELIIPENYFSKNAKEKD